MCDKNVAKRFDGRRSLNKDHPICSNTNNESTGGKAFLSQKYPSIQQGPVLIARLPLCMNRQSVDSNPPDGVLEKQLMYNGYVIIATYSIRDMSITEHQQSRGTIPLVGSRVLQALRKDLSTRVLSKRTE